MHNVPFYCFSASPAGAPCVWDWISVAGGGPAAMLCTAAMLPREAGSGRPQPGFAFTSIEGFTSMAKIIKVRCTGKGQHENEIDLDTIVGKDVVIYGNPIDTGRSVPARVVRRCDECDEGRVVVTREMIEENF